MDLHPGDDTEAFRHEVREFLESSLSNDFAVVRGRGGPGDADALIDERRAWERHLAEHGWTCVAWPEEYGGRGLSLHEQVVFFEEYARAGAPGRLGHIGETLVGPTLIAYGTPEQQRRFLPAIRCGDAIWCQGYSEPDAGSDLANLSTRAELVDGSWVINGQKVWTSGAHVSDWSFVLARTDPSTSRQRGISYLLVPMDQPGVEVRPINQMTGDSEFAELFLQDARTEADLVVGEPGGGWAVAMGTLNLERGASTLGQNLHFQSEWQELVERARENNDLGDPVLRQRIVDMKIRLEVMRLNALRILSEFGTNTRAQYITKLFWSELHRDLTELAVDLRGVGGLVGDDPVADLVGRRFLFSRSDTIYAGSSEIQRNLIAERGLELPKEPK